MIKIEPIKAFSDNYIWLVTTNEGLLVVDPGDASPVEAYLQNNSINLSNILITHHHFDHTGGVENLVKDNSVNVYGPTSSIFNGINKELKDGDEINVIGINFSIIEVPGHTLDHIAFFAENDGNPLLFCGDTLFAGGCGRIFEGSFEQMFESLSKLSQLPSNTKIYCGHEYTLSNSKFCKKFDSENKDLQKKIEKIEKQRDDGIPTIPSTLKDELECNIFLRAKDVKTFSKLRDLKDNF